MSCLKTSLHCSHDEQQNPDDRFILFYSIKDNRSQPEPSALLCDALAASGQRTLLGSPRSFSWRTRLAGVRTTPCPDSPNRPGIGGESHTLRDGAHDFDFNIGVWHTHIKRVPIRCPASSDSMELNGTVTVRKVWGGRAQLEEIEANGPNGHWEGLTAFSLQPGISSVEPDLHGQHVGHAERSYHRLIQQTVAASSSLRTHSREVDPGSRSLVGYHARLSSIRRIVFRRWRPELAPGFYRQPDAEKNGLAPSDSGTDPGPDEADTASATPDGQHDFDFDLGTWKTHSTRLLHPLTGSKDLG